MLRSSLNSNTHYNNHIFLFVTAAGAQLTAPNATCPGQEAVFTCLGDDASGFGATVFRVNDNTTGQCQLDHDMMAPSTLTCGPGGVFTAALEPRVGITYTSILTVTATEKLNGVTIRCLSGSVNKSESLQVISKYTLPSLLYFLSSIK